MIWGSKWGVGNDLGREIYHPLFESNTRLVSAPLLASKPRLVFSISWKE